MLAQFGGKENNLLLSYPLLLNKTYFFLESDIKNMVENEKIFSDKKTRRTCFATFTIRDPQRGDV
jgi:hypothetical protein